MRRAPLSCAAGALMVCTYMAFSLGSGASAQGPSTFPDPNLAEGGCSDASKCGKVSALIPMQSTEAVHMGLVWKRNSDAPKILYHARFPEYTPNDVADPVQVDAVLNAPRNPTTGLSLVDNGANDFNRSLRDVLHPSFRDGSNPTADSFQRLTYGGYLLRQGLSQSVPTRIVANRTMERQLLFDPSHPDASKTTGKYHTSVLDEADFALNRAAFAQNGVSKGSFYNTYCNARVTLSDGKVYVFGGHDMQSNTGLFKVNVFDPETEEWVRRTPPCTLTNWRSDPFGTMFFGDPNHPERASDLNANFEGCNQRVQESTQASDASDQKYARWYPSAAPLPNDWVLVLGGFDQDTSVGPDPTRGTRTTPQQDAAFAATRVNIVVPEVYDPVSDRNIALENARMAFPLYPQMEVVGTGPGKEDWMVCTMNGEENFGPETVPGGAPFFGPWQGKTWCLDVIAAMKDPKRHVPAQKHWRKLDTSDEVRPYCCPTASFIELNGDGETVSQKWFMISGQKDGAQTGNVEVMDFKHAVPEWRRIGVIGAPLITTKAVVLPDGKVLIGHGVNRGACTVNENGVNRPCTFSEKEGHFFQMFDPVTGSVTQLARTTVSRGLHGTASLLPDASVFFAGENREALVRNDDPSFPMAASWAPDGMLRRGDPDQGVPVGQFFYPPYLFTNDGGNAARLRILSTPRTLPYRGHFDIKVEGRSDRIASVVLLRSDHNTHSLTAGDRYVKLAFRPKGDASKGELRIVAPKLPAQAVPGIYMLFVLDANGVPSMGRQVRLMPETRGSTTAFR
jgi:Domain of unknown function (DUF1929)/Kelch motif